MALTKQGYKRETYEDIVARMELKAKEQFGQDIDTSERSFIGMFIRNMALPLADAWQDNENIYNSAYLKSAEGKQLDALLPYVGTSRDGATNATGYVVFSGTAGTRIELGTIVTKADDTQYYTKDDAVIDVDGTATVAIIAEQAGIIGNADIGTINKILNPVEGLESVTNLVALTDGREKESDAEVREKASLTVEGMGTATTAAIRTSLLQLDGVRAAFVDENYGDETNAYGTPIHAIQAFVLGGDDTAIAQAILDTKCAGIRPYGADIATAVDLSGQEKEIGFTRAETVNVSVRVTLTTNASFESDGRNQVIKAITQCIGGLDAEGNVYNGLNMGDDVILSKLIARIYSVNGIDDVDVQLSTDGENYVDSNIIITQQQVAETSANAIEVI